MKRDEDKTKEHHARVGGCYDRITELEAWETG